MAKKASTKYVCQACGYESVQFYGKCPNCGAWNQMEEERVYGKTIAHPEASHTGHASSRMKPTKLDQVKGEETPRVQTQMGELNRVLGGGVVQGSLVLIGGDPGIGKSADRKSVV